MSTFHLNPMAPPFSSCAFDSWQQICAAPPAGCFVLPECLYPPASPLPLTWGGDVACCCRWCGGGFPSKGCAYSAVGVPAFPPPACVPAMYPPPPPPPLVTVMCCPPPCPPPAPRCTITEIVDDGSAMTEGDDDPSPRSVLAPWRSPKCPKALPPKRPKKLKRRTAPAHPPPPQPPRRPPSYGYKPEFDPSSNRTSLMICNVPNNFSKRRFMAILDQHCAEENDMLLWAGGDSAVVKSEYDFLYVPIDFGTRCNKGYAFVNMTTPTAARRLHAFLHGHSWDAVGSQKVCQVVHADVEGVDAFVALFADSQFPCHDKEFLPVRFGPARDGFRRTAERVVGRCFQSARSPR